MASPNAHRARELNAAISLLWRDMATHDKTDFGREIAPIYTALLEQLKRSLGSEAAEQQLLRLLAQTSNACRDRWSLRLPLKRPGSDYRKYEIVYTYALITAMAVDCLRNVEAVGASPLDTALRLLPAEGLARLRGDAMLWEDWVGYFNRAETGGLYAVAMGEGHRGIARTGTVQKTKITPIREDAQPAAGRAGEPGSGKAILAAIRAGLADGSLSFNQPDDVIQVDRQGRTFLQYPAVLQWCKERLGLQEDLKRIQNRFDRLKLCKRSADGKQLFRGRLRPRDARVRGYVFEDASVLWPQPPPPGRFVIERLTTLT